MRNRDTEHICSICLVSLRMYVGQVARVWAGSKGAVAGEVQARRVRVGSALPYSTRGGGREIEDSEKSIE